MSEHLKSKHSCQLTGLSSNVLGYNDQALGTKSKERLDEQSDQGLAGKRSDPPLTDVSIGAYTVGVAMLALGFLGVEEEPMAHGSLLAIGGGLAVALPTALTGLLPKRATPPVADALVPGRLEEPPTERRSPLVRPMTQPPPRG